MSEEILINVTPRETRVALIENGMLQEIGIERASRRGYVGNIYKGKVSRVMPGMQAAFVDVGLERTAFLHASDLQAPAVEPLAEGEAAPAEPPPPASITELVREGHELIVQVVKDPSGTKGARLTTHLSIPSRYLVLLPEQRTLGISVRIEDESERTRLREIMQRLAADSPYGYIVRTNADGVAEEALAADLAYLGRVWAVVRERMEPAAVGQCVYEDLSLSLRALRDLMRSQVDKVRIDSREALERAQGFCAKFLPELADRIELYSGERPIFDLFGVEDEIQRALGCTAPLKSGGHLTIEQTEAMTTIDVNTGGFLGHRNLEETVYKTNLEAAQAIARQLRLRNLGGIIILDFIDMNDEEHRRQVLRTLERALARDNAKTTVYEFSPLGLVEMTRKRTTESLERLLCMPCQTCSGRGRIKSTETMIYEIFREITRAVRQFEAGSLLVLASTAVVNRIVDEESAAVADLETFIGKPIRFQAEDQYSPEQYDVVLL